MKYKNLMRKRLPLNLQFFAEPGGNDGDSGQEESAGGGDDQDADEADEAGEESSEKKYTEQDMEEAVKKRLARERRKWQREHQSNSNKSAEKLPAEKQEDDSGESEELRKEREKSSALELKWACLEHDVKRSCVDDVLALAKVYAGKEKDLDIEDAIDKVLEKYPQFKEGAEEDSGDDGTGQEKKGWGQRHGKSAKQAKTLDDELKNQLFGGK